MKLLLQAGLFCAVILGFQGLAHAVSITNLASVPHRVSIQTVGNGVTVADIPAGGTYHLNAFPEAKMALVTEDGTGTPVVGREKDVFAIWPDGTFGPQMKRRFRSKDNN